MDETELQIGKRTYYLWVALDPDRRGIWYVALTEVRNLMLARSFFKAIRRVYGRFPERVITDGGTWYPWALRSLGIRHEVVKGGIRSYIERWNETLKDRTRSFDKYHPCRRHGCDGLHVLHWAIANVFYYNKVRPHLSLGDGPPIPHEDWNVLDNRTLFLKRFMEALS
ncbi:MAG: DDE-type integrase/transposase/recombinase [Thermoplasmata archaeon]|nr:DDE-type integrase/transposase/recombinase [Thermoplasmata archaeon]